MKSLNLSIFGNIHLMTSPNFLQILLRHNQFARTQIGQITYFGSPNKSKLFDILAIVRS